MQGAFSAISEKSINWCRVCGINRYAVDWLGHLLYGRKKDPALPIVGVQPIPTEGLGSTRKEFQEQSFNRKNGLNLKDGQKAEKTGCQTDAGFGLLPAEDSAKKEQIVDIIKQINISIKQNRHRKV